ncbi:UNVERIFIED_CONTAM: hypothetical protein PYX00_008079 [Menopon gallinae]|uniref:Uncharacterized protein n=1 Tax=Menopon gallinae TaxID=328185 RepID=A0AAW2HLD4_9NEOP
MRDPVNARSGSETALGRSLLPASSSSSSSSVAVAVFVPARIRPLDVIRDGRARRGIETVAARSYAQSRVSSDSLGKIMKDTAEYMKEAEVTYEELQTASQKEMKEEIRKWDTGSGKGRWKKKLEERK